MNLKWPEWLVAVVVGSALGLLFALTIGYILANCIARFISMFL